MASVHKLPGKPNWFAFYSDRNGARRCKTTGTAHKREALKVAYHLQAIEDKARTGNLTPDRARKVIESAVAEIMVGMGAPMPRKTVREHFAGWKDSYEHSISEGTFTRYSAIVDDFVKFLGAKANRPLPALASDDVERYRQRLAGKVSGGSVNVALKVLRVSLEPAVKQGAFDRNPARLVDNMATSEDRQTRRPFTLEELRKILAVASMDWKTAILSGLYTGLRLGDVSALTWANLDLQKAELTCATQKTGRTQILPIAPPLLRHLESLPAGDDPAAPLCPTLHDKASSSGALSNEFFELMASAGLVKARKDHSKKKKGRRSTRQLSKISFHSLRHTATSLLKNAGVSDSVVMDIIGHDSALISRNYTHIDESTKRTALDKMPDVFATEPPKTALK
jgi:integrase